MFTRGSFVPGIGQANEAIGAAFGLPAGTVSAPVRTRDGMFVLRVDRRVNADSALWEVQKMIQRAQQVESVRNQRVQRYIEDLRQAAKIDDRRKQINAAQRRQSI
jgi:peptidyl-prolyl cis-trans isomerase D